MKTEIRKMVEQSYKLLTCLDLPYSLKTKPKSEPKRKAIQTLAKFINFSLPFKKSLRLLTDLGTEKIFAYELDLEELIENGFGEFFDLENDSKRYIWFQSDSEPYKSLVAVIDKIPILLSIDSSDQALNHLIAVFKELYKKNKIKYI